SPSAGTAARSTPLRASPRPARSPPRSPAASTSSPSCKASATIPRAWPLASPCATRSRPRPAAAPGSTSATTTPSMRITAPFGGRPRKPPCLRPCSAPSSGAPAPSPSAANSAPAGSASIWIPPPPPSPPTRPNLSPERGGHASPEPMPLHPQRRLQPVGDLQLVVGMVQMALHRRLADLKLRRNLLVALPLRQRLQHALFARRQPPLGLRLPQ